MKRERLSESSPAFRILAVEPRYEQICKGTGYPRSVAGTCVLMSDAVIGKSGTSSTLIHPVPFPTLLHHLWFSHTSM